MRWNRGNPVTWAQTQAERLNQVAGTLGERLQPNVSIVMIPAGEDASDPLVSQVAQAVSETNPGPPTASAPAAAQGADDLPPPPPDAEQPGPPVPPPPASSPATDDATEAVVEASPTATAQPTATTVPTATPQPTAVELSAATNTPVANTPVPLLSRSLTVTASATLTTTPALTATGTGGLLSLPTPTPLTTAPTAVPTPAVQAVVKVRSGDTLFDIAIRYDLSVEEVLEANAMTEDDAFTIQPGDELKIPAPLPTATTTPTTDPLATPTPTATASPTPTTTPSPSATPSPAPKPTEASTIRLDAPQLRSPEDGASISCNDEQSLNWLAVPSIQPTDLYVVHLGYVNGAAGDGSEQVVWVIAQTRPFSATSWQLDNSLCGLAPLESGRQWRWYVDVAEKTASATETVSLPSATWRFTWQ